ncbi:hypothetical protein C8R43DRAFT_1155957 [Mycena crocata]|nr:hypothetical protein C8R43DRAFT_1155957 [Mycena crocata]
MHRRSSNRLRFSAGTPQRPTFGSQVINMVTYSVLRSLSVCLLLGTSVLGQKAIDPECQSACPADLQAKAGSSDASTRCTNDVVSRGAICLGCEASLGKLSQGDAQTQMDAVVFDCAAKNHPVNSVTVTANGPSNGGASGGSNGGSGKPNSGEHAVAPVATAGLIAAGLTSLIYAAL